MAKTLKRYEIFKLGFKAFNPVKKADKPYPK